MLETSHRKILERLGDHDLVLDVGGGADPFPRADWVIDLLPYETRGELRRLLYPEAREARASESERFSAETWVQRDVCDREPWPFADDQFDFVICSHTLEDLRDPVWACSELSRVGRAGYVEVPSRLEEQAVGFQGPWVGWGHHHWFTEVRDGTLEFVFKHHIIHGREEYQIPRDLRDLLGPEERVETLWWEDSVPARERIFTREGELDRWLEEFVDRSRQRFPEPELWRSERGAGWRLVERVRALRR